MTYWPINGGFDDLLRACRGCRSQRSRAIPSDRDAYIQAMPTLTQRQKEHWNATHEAGHAVVGAVSGQIPQRLLIEAAPAGGAIGRVDWGDAEVDGEYAIACTWAGLYAGYRWLQEFDLDTAANRIDVVLGAHHDAIRAEELIAESKIPADLGRALGKFYVERHWDTIMRVADRLAIVREMTGRDLADAIGC
jgi:hypothetical protein